MVICSRWFWEINKQAVNLLNLLQKIFQTVQSAATDYYECTLSFHWEAVTASALSS